jgi:hypothetical protein
MIETRADPSGRKTTKPFERLTRQFNPLTRRRFVKARREHELGRVQGEPTEEQQDMAESIATLEWGARFAEHEGTLRALREAREFRRLLLKVRADFELTLAPQQAPSGRKATDALGVIKGRFS